MLLAAVLLLAACATPLQPDPQPELFALPPDPAAVEWEPLRSNLPTNEAISWFDVQDVGPDALRWRLALMDASTASLDAQYFIWRDDAVGSLLLERLLRAADRGVRARLLLDDSFLSGEDPVLIAVDAHPNVEVRIFNPINDLSQRDVQIKALTNSLASNNHVAAHTAYRHRRKQLLEAGVELHELRPHAPERTRFEAPGFTADHIGLHAKILVLDKRFVFVGTLNADPRSIVLNTEVSLMIDSPELAEAILSAFSTDFTPQNSWRIVLGENRKLTWHSSDGVLDRQPAGSIWRRIGDFFIGLLPIDEQM